MIEELQASDRAPFTGELRMPVDFSSSQDRLRTLGERVVVRLVHDALSDTRRLSHCLELFRELADFGVSTPPIWAVVGRGEDASSGAFIVTLRVQGHPLSEGSRSSKIAAMATEELCCALARYDHYKFRSGGDYLVDMKIENFVFGSLSGRSGRPIVYWIDHDPVYATFDPAEATPTTIAQTHLHVAEVTNLVIHGEQLGDTRFRSARAELEPLFDLMTESESGPRRVDELRRGLEASEAVDGRAWVQEEHAKLDAAAGYFTRLNSATSVSVRPPT